MSALSNYDYWKLSSPYEDDEEWDYEWDDWDKAWEEEDDDE